MKIFISILLTALLSFAGCLFLPWWFIAIAAFMVAAVVGQNGLRSFLCGFVALFALWGLSATIIDVQNHHLLSSKVARLLPLAGQYQLLILFTGLVAGLVGGMAALTGSFVKRNKI